MHGLAVEGQDDVAALDAGAIRRAARFNGADDGTTHLLQTEAVGHFLRDRLDRDAELRPPHVSVGLELGHHMLRHVDRNREADADVAVVVRQNL